MKKIRLGNEETEQDKKSKDLMTKLWKFLINEKADAESALSAMGNLIAFIMLHSKEPPESIVNFMHDLGESLGEHLQERKKFESNDFSFLSGGMP